MSPHVSCCVLGMSCHVLGMSWACPGHVQVMSEAPSNSLLMHFFSIFFNFFQFFFSTLFAKNQLCYVKFVNPLPCSELFTWISFIIFHILATEAPSNSLLMHFFQLFSIFFIFFYFFQEKSLFFYVKFISPPHVQTFLYQFHKWFFIFWR